MAVQVIDDGKFILKDNWPGPVVQVPIPDDMTEVYSTSESIPCPLGTKVAIYQPTNHGFATFMLLQYEKGTASAAAIKSLCAPDITEAAAAGAQYIVTNDGGEAFKESGMAAMALNTLADGNCAWFWIGGVCPVDTVPGLDGTHATSVAAITAGDPLTMADSASVIKLASAAFAVNDGATKIPVIPCGVTFIAVTTS